MLFFIVPSGPILLDHLGCLQEEGRRDREAESLGCLQIDHQLELGGPLHWKVGRIGVFENFETVPGFSIAKVLASTPAMARPLGRLGGVDRLLRQKKGCASE